MPFGKKSVYFISPLEMKDFISAGSMQPVKRSAMSLRPARREGIVRPDMSASLSIRSNSLPEVSSPRAFKTLRENLKGLAVETMTAGVRSPVLRLYASYTAMATAVWGSAR